MESVCNGNGIGMEKLITYRLRPKFGELEWNWKENGMEHL